MIFKAARRGIRPRNTVPREGRGLCLSLGGRGGDLAEPVAGVGHPDRQGDGRQRDQVAARLRAGLRRAQRDGHVDRHDEILDGFSPIPQEPAHAVGCDREQDIVDGRVVAVRDLGDLVQAGADEGEVAAGADDAVQAGAGPGRLGGDLPDGRPVGPHVPRGGHRPGQRPE
jgi:hypothetical protein